MIKDKLRKVVFFVVLYGSLFLAGLRIEELLRLGLKEDVNVMLQLAGLIGNALAAAGAFYMLYIYNKKKVRINCSDD
jgi:hypothetical protein